MFVVALMFMAGMGILLAFVVQPSPAPAASLTDTTPDTAPTTTVAPTPDPAPKPKPAPAPKHTAKPVPTHAPAYHAPTPAPTYYPPAATRTVPATPVVHARSAPVGTSKPSVRKNRHPQRQRRPLHVKRNVAPAVAGETKTPSPATTGDAGAILLLVCLTLGALLITIAMVVPAAARFTSPGRVVIEHRLDLALLGVALFVLTGLVYLLGTAGQ